MISTVSGMGRRWERDEEEVEWIGMSEFGCSLHPSSFTFCIYPNYAYHFFFCTGVPFKYSYHEMVQVFLYWGYNKW